MAGAAPLLFNLLSATAPLKSNPAFGAVEHTPDDMLQHINSLPENQNDPYESADEARNDGYKIPQQSLWMNPKTGEDVTKYVSDSSYGQNPYKTPGFWQRFVNPEAANRETEGNTAFQQAPGMAAASEKIRSDVIGGRLSQQPSFMNPQNLSSFQRYSLNMGDMNPGQLNAANVATGEAKAGVPATQVATDIAQSKRNLQMTQGALDRTPAENALLDQQIVNQLHAETNLEPARIQDAINEIRGKIGRSPTVEETKGYIANAENREANLASQVAGTKLDNADIVKKTVGNSLLSEYANSIFQQPPSSRLATTYTRDPVGNIKFATGYDPRAVDMQQAMAAKLTSPTFKDKSGNVLPPPPLKSGTLGDTIPVKGGNLKTTLTTDNEDNFNKILDTPVNSLATPDKPAPSINTVEQPQRAGEEGPMSSIRDMVSKLPLNSLANFGKRVFGNPHVITKDGKTYIQFPDGTLQPYNQ